MDACVFAVMLDLRQGWTGGDDGQTSKRASDDQHDPLEFHFALLLRAAYLQIARLATVPRNAAIFKI
jgi:hypothetical protein